MMPKFSIRQMLWAMVGVALLSLCMSSAWRGNRPALGLSVAIIGSFIPFKVYAFVHWFAFVVALIPFPGKLVSSTARRSALQLADSASTTQPGSSTTQPGSSFAKTDSYPQVPDEQAPDQSESNELGNEFKSENADD